MGTSSFGSRSPRCSPWLGVCGFSSRSSASSIRSMTRLQARRSCVCEGIMFPVRCAAVTLALFAFIQSLAAEQYPARPVTIVAPYAAGGGADLIARLIALKLGERLGQSFLVENRLGAGGVIAANSVAKAAPDGYTLFMGASTQLAIQVTLHKKLPYDPAADFMPVALLASVPFVLIVHPSLPVHPAADLVRLAHEKTGQLPLR